METINGVVVGGQQFDFTPINNDSGDKYSINKRFSDVSNKLASFVLTSICDAHYTGENLPVIHVSDTDAEENLHFRSGDPSNPLIMAQTAISLAKLIKSGAHDPALTGHTEDSITSYIHKLVVTLANHHKANMTGGWGVDWQSPFHAASAASCAILFEELFTAEELQLIKNMVLAETAYVLSINSTSGLFWKDKNGTVYHPGDTKSEEDLWNSMICGVAMIMCPDAQNIGDICDWFVFLNIAGCAKPSDTTNWRTISGYQLSTLNGYNIQEDGTLINHDRVHPHYMVSMEASIFETLSIMAYKHYLVPIGALYNKEVIAKAMYNVDFVNTDVDTPYEGNGGHIYQPGDWNIYYPQGNDWTYGVNKMTINESSFDKCIKELGLDANCDWDAWASLHLTLVEYLQNRHEDGHLYENGETGVAENRREVSALQQITTPLMFMKYKPYITSLDNWKNQSHYDF